MSYQDLQRAVQLLAGVCDGAATEDGVGFNGADAAFGHSLAKQEEWSPKQARAAWRMISKYRSQLKSYGVDYEQIPEPVIPEIAAAREKKIVTASRVIWLDGKTVVFSFPFDRDTINAIKERVPGAKWSKPRSRWEAKLVPATILSVVGFAEAEGFSISDALWNAIDAFEEEFTVRRSLSVSDGTDLPPLGIESQMQYGTLRPFQRAGVAYAVRAKRCMIADQMGLGKTVQSIAAVKELNAFPCITVVPAVVKLKWVREWQQWFFGLKVEVLSGRKPEKLDRSVDVYVINYDILQDWAEEIVKLSPKSIIYDESHYLKNSKTNRFSAAKVITKNVPVCYMLSGTPIENGVMEFATQLKILDRLDDLGGWWHFSDYYAGARKMPWGGYQYNPRNLEELNEKLRMIGYVRRLKADVAKDLPSKTRSIDSCDLDNWSEYRKARDQFLAWVADRAIDAEFLESLAGMEEDERLLAIQAARSDAAARAAAAEMLVQLAALKRLVAEGKYSSALEWIDDFRSSGEKLIVFGWHRSLTENLAAHYNAPKIIGGMSAEDRQAAADKFMNDPKCDLIFCNLRAAGVGVDLYAASNVLFLELGWTPTIHDQAEDRAHRIGQTKPVTAWYLLADRTIDKDLYELIEAKRVVVEAATDGRTVRQSSMMKDLVKKMMEGV